MNTLGVKPGSRLLNVLVVLKIGALAVLILGGLWRRPVARGSARRGALPPRPPATFFAFAAALVPILFSYGGWQSANTVAEEIRSPERTLPRALVAGTVLVVIVYVAVNVVYLATLGARRPGGDGDAGRRRRGADLRLRRGPLDRRRHRDLDLRLPGRVAARADPHLLRDGAGRRLLPRASAICIPASRRRTARSCCRRLWSIVLVLTGTYGDLIDSVVFADWIFFGLTVAAVIVLRRRIPLGRRGRRRIRGSPGVPRRAGSLRRRRGVRRGRRRLVEPGALGDRRRDDRRGRRPSTLACRAPARSPAHDPRPRSLHGVGQVPARGRASTSPAPTCFPARSRTCPARARPSTSPGRAPRATSRCARRSRRATASPSSASRPAAAARAPTSSPAPRSSSAGDDGPHRDARTTILCRRRPACSARRRLLPPPLRGRVRRRSRRRGGRADARGRAS